MQSLRRVAYVVLVLEAALLLNGCPPKPPSSPPPYSCSAQPCSANVLIWNGVSNGVPGAVGAFAPMIVGYQTSIYVNPMSGGDQTIRNSLILTSGAVGSSPFVEVGYIAQGVVELNFCGQVGTYYFWQDTGTAGIPMVHTCQPVPPGDFGHYAVVEIENYTDTAPAPTFGVFVTSQAFGWTPCAVVVQEGEHIPAPFGCPEALWTPGSGVFAQAQLGQMLTGSQGASAAMALFVNNAYQASSGVSTSWPPQAANGSVSPFTLVGTAVNPPYGDWVEEPSTSGSAASFFTECCLAPYTVFPNNLDFGAVSTGTPDTLTLAVSNTSSTSTLDITGMNITGSNHTDFSSTTNCSNSLAPFGTCTITVTFTPSVQGTESATLTVTDNGGSGSGSETVSLSGTGQ